MPRLFLNAQVLLKVSLAPGNHTRHKCTRRGYSWASREPSSTGDSSGVNVFKTV